VQSSGNIDFTDDSPAMTESTISGIGSITKQFTAATLIKLWDEDLTKSQAFGAEVSAIFPEGIDTKFANFMPALRERFPQSSKQFDRIEGDPSYPKVTLRDLLSHTHGLGGRNDNESYKLLRATGERPLELHEIINITEKEYHENSEGERPSLMNTANFVTVILVLIWWQ
jgi:CubicO group peptidase (beta-lactamase class C family)